MVQCDGPNNTPPFWPIMQLYFGWFLSSISGEIGGLLVGLAHDNGMFHHFVAIQWGYKYWDRTNNKIWLQKWWLYSNLWQFCLETRCNALSHWQGRPSASRFPESAGISPCSPVGR